MATLNINATQQFEHVIKKGISVVDFSAHWCGPCRAQDSILDALEKTYEGKATVTRLNIDENQMVAMDLGIQSIPTILIFREGIEIKRFVGLQSAETLNAALKAALTV